MLYSERAKKLALLKVIKVKTAGFATTGFLIMDSNIKILHAMAAMI